MVLILIGYNTDPFCKWVGVKDRHNHVQIGDYKDELWTGFNDEYKNTLISALDIAPFPCVLVVYSALSNDSKIKADSLLTELDAKYPRIPVVTIVTDSIENDHGHIDINMGTDEDKQKLADCLQKIMADRFSECDTDDFGIESDEEIPIMTYDVVKKINKKTRNIKKNCCFW